MFYLKDAITICKGEKITGTLECRPNEKNERDLDVVIEYKFEGSMDTCTTEARMEYRMR